MPVAGSAESTERATRLDEVTTALADLATVLNDEEDLGRVLQRSVDQVVRAVPGADMASVTVVQDGKAETLASSTERVWAIDADQYAAGDGPCLQAARTGEIQRVGVEEAQERWPEFARSARAAGIASYLAHPMIIDAGFVGSMNLYSEQPHGFDDFDVSVLRLYVTAACAATAEARRYAQARDLARNLRRAMESRAVIDQACGVLMARQALTADQALGVLKRESQNTNVKLRDVATRVIEGIRPR